MRPPPVTDEERARRRHPAERRMSFLSGSLLLVMIAQAAFGYALVEPGRAAWVRATHVGMGLAVVLLVLWMGVSVRWLPDPGRRRSALQAMTYVLVAFVAAQALMGLGLGGHLDLGLTLRATDHIALGLLLTFLVLAVHMTCIWPSIRLGARREWEASLAPPDHDLDRKL